MKKIELLDCTLRDGAYITDSKFDDVSIKGIIAKLDEANIDVIECGWLKNSAHEKDSTFFHVPSDLEQYIVKKNPNHNYVVMIDWDRYDLNNLPECDGKSIDAIRVVFPYGKHKEGINVAKQIKNKGYLVYLQAANTLAYNENDLIELAKDVNDLDPVALSVVDTFGAMYPEDLVNITNVLHKHLEKHIKLGFHSHNNQQLSFALSIDFLKYANERDLIVDSSLCGIGRGAGNTTTELIASYINRKLKGHYNLDAIMDAIDTYMEYYKEKYEWGYSTPYFIAGLYCCHVNNIAYLLNNHRTNSKDMRNIIESLSESDRKKYDYDLLESKFIQNKNYQVDDSSTLNNLRTELQNRKVLLLAPGKSIVDYNEKVKQFIEKEKPVIIGVNALSNLYQYDYMFISNTARYNYVQSAYNENFKNLKKIILSTVKNNCESELEYIINFNKVIKQGWKYFDNAMICALRLMELIGVSNIYIAGFDGFSTEYNKSYCDEFLPSLNSENNWDILNSEIKAMFLDLKSNMSNEQELFFITPSIFNDLNE